MTLVLRAMLSLFSKETMTCMTPTMPNSVCNHTWLYAWRHLLQVLMYLFCFFLVFIFRKQARDAMRDGAVAPAKARQTAAIEKNPVTTFRSGT